MSLPLSDIALARRLERAEGAACMRFAQARLRVYPDSGAEWIEHAGAHVVFDGVDSPITQCFGLGIQEPLTTVTLDTVEEFFFSRGAHTDLEVCPLAGVPAVRLLCGRGYRPVEISSVLYQPVYDPPPLANPSIRVRRIEPEEAPQWTEISARGWCHEHPELYDFVMTFGSLCAVRDQSPCFLAELDGVPGTAASISLNEGVALFAGASTVPELRRRGLQAAALQERMRYAHQNGCDLAMMVAEAGSTSQRNAERRGFRIAYTRTKWRLEHPGRRS